MKKFLLALAFVATAAFAADDLPTNQNEILEHCNGMANFAASTAMARKNGVPKEKVIEALNETLDDPDASDDLKAEIRTAVTLGWLGMAKFDTPREVGFAVMKACVNHHRVRLGLPPLGKTT